MLMKNVFSQSSFTLINPFSIFKVVVVVQPKGVINRCFAALFQC